MSRAGEGILQTHISKYEMWGTRILGKDVEVEATAGSVLVADGEDGAAGFGEQLVGEAGVEVAAELG